jgi:glycosyltransferase involved in cell wall biosynthesis
MCRRLLIPRDLINVVYVGIDLEGYEPAALDFNPPVLGYLSRMNSVLGLDKLVDAFIELKKTDELRNLKLKATGGAVGDDRKCISDARKRLEKAGFEGDAEFIEDFSRDDRIKFVQSLSVMCVPVEQGEAFGSYIIEAMAVGVPVIQPDAGAFPELIAATGGGEIYKELVPALKQLLTDPEHAKELGRRGREAVCKDFSIESMAKNMIAVYRELLAG